MSTKLGHFEIVSELAKSATGTVYKANDEESGQTIALKAIPLSVFGESAGALEQALLAEAENTKVLASPNITNVSSASVIDGQFCAAMEYIQGNSIATMLARKEGFSIWDLLDIGRQLCSGLEHAKSHNVVHYSLEPSKVMCGWDGTVKILGYGVSSVGNFAQHIPETVPSILHYMSPEQVRGQAIDHRSNLFSLGAMLYEMVTERKAFDREDADGLRQSIVESTPMAPARVNPKIHPLLNDLIMKALAKDPGERYQSGRELLDDLEKCKESKTATKKVDAPKSAVPANKPNAAAQAKFVGATTAKPGPSASDSEHASESISAVAAKPARRTVATKPVSKLAVPKAAAAAAGVGSDLSSSASETPELDLSNHFSSANPAFEEPEAPAAYMSAAVADELPVKTFEPQVHAGNPKIAVDPMMAEGESKGNGAVSFSEMTELPPLKEVYIAPPPPPVEPVQSVAPTKARFQEAKKANEKPKVQPRVVAQKAIKEIKGVPPKLMLYSVAGAVALIIIIAIGVLLYVHGLNSDIDPGAGRSAAVDKAPAQPVAHQTATQPTLIPDSTQPEQAQADTTPDVETSQPKAVASYKGKTSKKKVVVAPVIIPGQLAIESTPEGAQVQVDGQTDASYVTPFALTNLQPGQHSITVSKAGYVSDTRTVNVSAGIRATTSIHLVQLMATLMVKSDPAGASIYVDGHDVGAKTPAQVSIDKGTHVVLVRMSGYIDETMSAQFVLGQTFNFSPTLRSLGNTDNLKTVGKMSKLFGGKGGQAGQGTVSIHTQPKGAQIAINQHMLEKNSPVDVMLDPGNYVLDITLTGYAPLHKIIAVDKGGKVVVDEVMQKQ